MSPTTTGNRHLCDCGRDLSYSYAHDARYCQHCDQWSEAGCENPDCIFCHGRLDKPSDHKLCAPKKP